MSTDNASLLAGKKILLVDDCKLLCEGVRRALRADNIDCITVTNGQEAIDLVKTMRFDLVVTDLMMPIMAGEQLVQNLQYLHPDLPCIIMTGNATKEAVLRLRGMSNVRGFLVKPWDRERLTKMVIAVFGKGRSTVAPAPASTPAPTAAPAAEQPQTPTQTAKPARAPAPTSPAAAPAATAPAAAPAAVPAGAHK